MDDAVGAGWQARHRFVAIAAAPRLPDAERKLLKLVRDRAERARELGADGRHADDNGGHDDAGDDRVFDRGDAALVGDQRSAPDFGGRQAEPDATPYEKHPPYLRIAPMTGP